MENNIKKNPLSFQIDPNLFNRATDMVNGRAVVAQWNTETNWNRLYMLEITE